MKRELGIIGAAMLAGLCVLWFAAIAPALDETNDVAVTVLILGTPVAAITFIRAVRYAWRLACPP